MRQQIVEALRGPTVDSKELLRLLALDLVHMQDDAAARFVKMETVVDHAKVSEKVASIIADRARMPVESSSADVELAKALERLQKKKLK